MALSSSRDLNRNKILEELELSKKILKQGAPVLAPNSGSGSSLSTSIPGAGDMPLSLQQRTALNAAHSQSFGYYIPQDSIYGNPVLPVLPRFDKK